MPSPATARTGYELRATGNVSGAVNVAIMRWQAGTSTTIASVSGVSVSAGTQLALVQKGGALSVWKRPGSEFTKVLSATDNTFTSGYTGIDAANGIFRISNFRSGPLAPF
jgi:hypothetical protein